MKQREQCMKDKYLYCVGWEAGKHGKHGKHGIIDAQKHEKAWKHGITEAQKHGSTKARKHGSTETQNNGSTEAQKHRSMEAWMRKHRSTGARKHDLRISCGREITFLLYIAFFFMVFECTWTKYFCSCFLVHRLLVNESWLAMIALHIILFLRLRRALVQHIYTVLHWQSPKKIVHVS